MPFLAVAFVALALDTATADQPISSTPPAAAGKAKERMVCRTEPVTGSRFSRRVCETEEAANKRRQEARDELERAKTQGSLRVAPEFDPGF